MSILAPVIWWALFATKVFALVDCLGRKQYDFEMADTLPKRIWLIILPLCLLVDVLQFQNPLGLLSLLGTLAALTYLAQLRGSTY